MEAVVEKVQIGKYPAYKDSGVEWLGEIPEHWEVKKLKNILLKIIDNRGRTPDFGYVGIPMLEIKNITDGMKNPTNLFEKFVSPEIVKRYERDKVKKGDILISTVGATCGKVVIIENEPNYFIAQNVVGLRISEELSSLFIYFLLGSEYFTFSLQSINKGNTIDNLKVSTFINNTCFIPPLSEQIKIANFLDQKTQKIDQAIEIKEKQILLLKERKQILIHNAVTRGLNPDVKLKDSGVEWIGEIPEHWEVKKLKNVCKMIVSNVDKHTKSFEQPVKLCNYVDVYKNDFITNKINFMDATASFDEIKRFRIKINDVIITKDSEDWLDIGVPALVKYEDENLICGYHLAILRPSYFMFGGFLYRALLSPNIKTQFSVKANGVTRYGISHGAILSSFISIPPFEEQVNISNFIDNITNKISNAISLKEKEIEKLKEYKATLINSAVTGKIKVF